MHDVSADNPKLTKQLVGKWEAWAKADGVLPWPWKPVYGRSAQSGNGPERRTSQLHFSLNQGDNLIGQDAPSAAHRGLAIRVEISELAPDGVLLAQGGSADGYSLYLKDGRLTFALRHGGKLESIRANDPLSTSPAVVSATLAKDGAVTIKSGDQVLATGSSAILTRQPKDGLQVGQDGGGAVGEYSAPFLFRGKLGPVTLDLQE